jgi:hypothetical protein
MIWLRYQRVISLKIQVGNTNQINKWPNTNPRIYRRWDQVPRRSMHPLLIDHTRCEASSMILNCLLRFKNWSYVEQALAYWISWEMYTPYAGDDGMLLHIYGKFTMVKLKSSRLPYNWVVSFPSASMFNKSPSMKLK